MATACAFYFLFFPLIFAWDIYLFFYLALLRQYYSIICLWQLYCLMNLKKMAGWLGGGGGREVNADGCVP